MKKTKYPTKTVQKKPWLHYRPTEIHSNDNNPQLEAKIILHSIIIEEELDSDY